MCLQGIVKGKDKGQERRFGSYEGLRRQWSRFVRKYGAYITENPVLLENTTVIQGGRCAVYGFRGSVKHIYAAYQTIFLICLPRTGYVVDGGRSLFDVYRRGDKDGGWIEMEICVPVRER